MQTRTAWLPVLLVAGLLLSATAPGEILSFSGSAAATVQEFRSNEAGQTQSVSDAFPEPTATLPLQVIAELVFNEHDAAAAAAAQFADPNGVTTPNPEEFAMNLALVSVVPDVSYTGTATSQEFRQIVFTTSEFPLRPEGTTLNFTGKLFLDGALAVFAPSADRDLTGANISLHVTVVKQVSGQDDQTVFSGSVTLEGTGPASVDSTAAGDFPTATLIRTNLAAFINDFQVFEVLIIPSVTVNYTFPGTIGETFTLAAKVEVEGQNLGDNVGVAAVIGTPLDTIRQVIAAAKGDSTATKTITALTQEREDPTGTPAFPTARTFLPGCGLFGFEFLLGVGALAGLRCRGILRRGG
jgi:hypothetical protein